MADNESNNTLYFIVGGLVVVAIVFAFFFFNPGKLDTGGTGTATSSQEKTSVDQTNVKVNEDGATITHTESK